MPIEQTARGGEASMMDSEIDGRDVWVVTVGEDPDWRLVGVYSSEGRAEAAIAHARQRHPDLLFRSDKVQVDEGLSGQLSGQLSAD